MAPHARVPAAQYLRMSTDQQEHSLENQASAISSFAASHGFEIVRTYEDQGRSGLTLKGRPGLQCLLRDVLCNPGFKAILVYDVSRWGRFQRLDEAAHHEFICRAAGVPIYYCAEPFQCSKGIAYSIFKDIKRSMAAEYSRELGIKVARGQRTLAELGYWMGGVAPFGYRRLLLSSGGTRVQVLEPGERKGTITDRVTLTPGPPWQVDTIRLIFELAANGQNIPNIAHKLNDRGIRTATNKLWTTCAIGKILHNRIYVGASVWGKTRTRLSGARSKVSKLEWTIRTHAHPALISEEVFAKAQRAVAKKKTDEELLDALRRAWNESGYVVGRILGRSRYPCRQTYIDRFGGLRKALKLIGYVPRRRAAREILRTLRPSSPTAQSRVYKRYDDSELLAELRRIWKRDGYIDYYKLTRSRPPAGVYWRHFGGLRKAYALIGYKPRRRIPAYIA